MKKGSKKEMKKDKKMNKKPLIAIVLIAIVGVIGGTLAVFTSQTSLSNMFSVGKYSTETEETFTPPTDWKPGQEITKQVFVRNTGDYVIAVRAKLEPQWTAADGHTHPELQYNGEDAAKINFDDTTNWVKGDDGYYYYIKALKKNDFTGNLIKSVTLNEHLDADAFGITCSETTTGDGKKSTCTSSDNSYAGATYELKIIVETIQYDAYASTWSDRGESVTITESE